MDTDRFLAWLYQTLQVSLDNRLNPSDFVKVYPCCSGRIIGFPAWSICGRVLPRDCEASRLGAARKTPPLSSHTRLQSARSTALGAGSRQAAGESFEGSRQVGSWEAHRLLPSAYLPLK